MVPNIVQTCVEFVFTYLLTFLPVKDGYSGVCLPQYLSIFLRFMHRAETMFLCSDCRHWLRPFLNVCVYNPLFFFVYGRDMLIALFIINFT